MVKYKLLKYNNIKEKGEKAMNFICIIKEAIMYTKNYNIDTSLYKIN